MAKSSKLLRQAAGLYGLDGIFGVCLRSQALFFSLVLPERYLGPRDIAPWPYFARQARAILEVDPMFRVGCFLELFRAFGIGALGKSANRSSQHACQWPPAQWRRFADEVSRRLHVARDYMEHVA